MKNFVKNICIISVAFAMAFALTTCSVDIVEEYVPKPLLLSITLVPEGGAGAGKPLDIPLIPTPIPHTDWDNEEYGVGGASAGIVVAKRASDTERVKITTEVSDDVKSVTYGIAYAGNRPDSFTNQAVRASFSKDWFLYIKVTAEDGITANYYRFYSTDASKVTELAHVTIADRDPNIALNTSIPRAALSLATLQANVSSPDYQRRIDITRPEATNGSPVKAEPQDQTATIRYAVATNQAAVASLTLDDFTDTVIEKETDANDKTLTYGVATKTFVDNNFLIVEVTAQNEEDKNYYAFLVTAGRIATIANLTFDGKVVTGKGKQHTGWNSVTPGSYSSADQQPGGFEIAIEPDDPESVCEWSVIAQGAANPNAFPSPQKYQFTHGQVLAIRVRSGRNATQDVTYYKVQVNLLAGNFTRQPKSAVYFVSGKPFATGTRVLVDSAEHLAVPVTTTAPIVALDFELDKTQGAGWTYQWYEANSWYGGYGFDRDGRIFGDAGYGEGLTSNDKDAYGTELRSVYGTGLGLDEKNNVSLHNGGNNFYRLIVPGRPIPGATDPTYTPKIDASKRPFIAGYSNQTHYYWVVITDPDNKKATSERAAIVAEWGEVWNLGRPTGQAVTKKHHIVDLHAHLTKTVGLQEHPRNTDPFKAGNHGDKRIIPITFPSDFNVMDYSVATVQARFFLSDGTPWIQNWTQGDVGFEKDGVGLVLYYNLTNNNATVGLSGDSKEPLGANLTDKPSHVVVKPAGTKPLKDLPPFQNDNVTPINTDDAQGWFTPYIEIVELRFEGPSRR